MVTAAWADVAAASGLALIHVSEAHLTAATFHRLRGEMVQGTRPRGSPGAVPWLHGARNDVAVVVRAIVLQQVGEARHHEPTHLSAIAEIDPPLFAGLRLASRELIPFHGLAHGTKSTGQRELDGRFTMMAFDGPRAAEVLLGRASLVEDLVRASRAFGVVVKDSSVELMVQGQTPTVERVQALVATATLLARELSRRAREITQSAMEIQARSAWHRLAVSLGLSVDPLRWHLLGRLADVDVSAMLEGSPPAVFVTFRARFRTRLACPFFLRCGFSKAAAHRTGYPELDRLLVLETQAKEQVRGLLASPELRALLAAEAAAANLMVDDTEIVLGRGGFATTREIRERLHALVAIVDALTPRPPAAGPFR